MGKKWRIQGNFIICNRPSSETRLCRQKPTGSILPILSFFRLQFYTHIPTQPLRSIVKSIYYYEGYCGTSQAENILPDGTPQWVIALDDRVRRAKWNPDAPFFPIELRHSWIKGICSSPITFEPEQDATVLSVQFEPGGLTRLLGVPAHELSEAFFSAEDLMGNDVSPLREQLLLAGSVMGKIVLIEQYLAQKLAQFDPGASLTDRILAQYPIESTALGILSDETGISQKHLIHTFKQQVGLTPKKLQLLWKVNKAIGVLSEGSISNFAQVAFDCGFYDQSHFILNFKRITGLTPKAYLSAARLYPHVITID